MNCRLILICLLIAALGSAQKKEYAAALIPAPLKENANAVLRKGHLKVDILSQNEMVITTLKAVTVFNENGLNALDLMEYYNSARKIAKIEARVYDASGAEIRVFRKKDFRDSSLGDGFSVFNDKRSLQLDYTPVGYPFTLVLESEVRTTNTAFIPLWLPIDNYYLSVEKQEFVLNCKQELGLTQKESNFDARYGIQKTVSGNSVSYTTSNIRAIKWEEGSPEFLKLVPVVFSKVEKFNLEGVNGEASNWEEFGKWYYNALLSGTDALPETTKSALKKLVGSEKDPIKIARIVYKFVQDRTRYVSIQVGIGGFKPMPASDVDKLGYGDCKALTNYTRALLESVGVTAYYTVVYAGSSYRRGLLPDFASVQGNHVILALPLDQEYVWLECTTQTGPFGFNGTFTDGRNVLVVKPDGGHLTKTSSYIDTANSQFTKGNYSIGAGGEITGSVSITSKGTQYDQVYGYETLSAKDRENQYKNYFSHIGGVKLGRIEFKNDRDAISFEQQIELTAPGYGSVTGDRLLFVVNALDKNAGSPKRYRNRENPFQVNRGYLDQGEVAISLPQGYAIEILPADFSLKSKYGEYSTSIVKNDDNSLVYKRTLLLKDGYYPGTEYEEYREFRDKISRNDNAKIVLVKQ